MDFTVPGGGWSSTAGSGTEVGGTDEIRDLGSMYRMLHVRRSVHHSAAKTVKRTYLW